MVVSAWPGGAGSRAVSRNMIAAKVFVLMVCYLLQMRVQSCGQ
jgi:hypothetical protein